MNPVDPQLLTFATHATWILPVMWIAMLAICEFGQFVARWIDDRLPSTETNILVDWFMFNVLKWEDCDDLASFSYRRMKDHACDAKNISNGHAALLYPVIILAIIPPVIMLCIVFYQPALIIVLLWGLAHLARLICRTRKVIDKHIDNHNNQ